LAGDAKVEEGEMGTRNSSMVGTTFEGQIAFGGRRKFCPLPTYGNIVIGVTEQETVYLWRGLEWRDEHSRRMVIDEENLAVLLVLNPATAGRRRVRVFSENAQVPNERAKQIVRDIGFNAHNSVWNIVPSEDVPTETWAKLKGAMRDACEEYAFHAYADEVAARRAGEGNWHDA